MRYKPMQEHEKHNTSPQVAVVIPHLDRIEDTAVCCQSLVDQSLPPSQIIIVDNASTMHTKEDLVRTCPDALVLRLDANKGFAGAVNIGIREALKARHLSHVLILNNDTKCPNNMIEALLAVSEADPANGLISCPLLEGGPEDKKMISPGKRLKGPWRIPLSATEAVSPDYLSGTCLLVKRKVLDEVGLFDEVFFFYWEDADFSHRATSCGWKLAVASDTMVEHRGSSTARCFSELLAQGYRAGHVHYLRKYSRLPLLRALFPFCLRLVVDSLSGHWAAVRGNWNGFFEGWQS